MKARSYGYSGQEHDWTLVKMHYIMNAEISMNKLIDT